MEIDRLDIAIEADVAKANAELCKSRNHGGNTFL